MKTLREMGHAEPTPQAPSTVDDAPPPSTGDNASEIEETKHRKRWGVGKTSAPTPYALPGPVTITPEPPHDPVPEETPQLKFTDNGKETDSDNDGLMDPIEGESKQQIEQRKAHNYRAQQQGSVRKVRMKMAEDDQMIYNESHPGCVPDGLGVITIRQHPERNNSFPGLLSQWFYYSPTTNTVYACNTVVAAAQFELDVPGPYQTSRHSRLYSIVHRGFPMNPHELRKLTQFVQNTHNSNMDCIEGFRLHTELHHLSCSTALELHDRTMREILGNSQYAPPHFDAPFPTSHTGWHHEPIPCARIAWESHGLGLPTPGPSSAFNIEQ
jgi:hypothetical protein